MENKNTVNFLQISVKKILFFSEFGLLFSLLLIYKVRKNEFVGHLNYKIEE